MSDLKNNLEVVLGKLKGLEERARGLKNQNIADVATSARAKIQQLSEHPDLELLDERKDQAHPGNPVYIAPTTKEEAVARMHANGSADPEGEARVTWPHLFDGNATQAPFPQSPPFDPNAPQPQAPHTGL